MLKAHQIKHWLNQSSWRWEHTNFSLKKTKTYSLSLHGTITLSLMSRAANTRASATMSLMVIPLRPPLCFRTDVITLITSSLSNKITLPLCSKKIKHHLSQMYQYIFFNFLTTGQVSFDQEIQEIQIDLMYIHNISEKILNPYSGYLFSI